MCPFLSQHHKIVADQLDFLKLSTDLAPSKLFEKKPDRYSNTDALRENIDICQRQHESARREWVEEHRRDAALWTTVYILKIPDMTVTSREKFMELLEDL